MKRNAPIIVGLYTKKQAEHLKEILAQRLRQTCGVGSMDDARRCFAVGSGKISQVSWWEISLASDRPVRKLDLSKGQMREYLFGVQKGEKIAAKQAKSKKRSRKA